MEQHSEAGGVAVVGAPHGYLVVIEAGPESYGAYVPDLPGCVAAAETREEVAELIQESIALYLETLQERGQPAPAPSSTAITIQTKSNAA